MLLTCASFIAIWSNCENFHSSSSDPHPIVSDMLASSIDTFPESSQLLETFVYAQVSLRLTWSIFKSGPASMRSLVLSFLFCGCAWTSSSDMTTFLLIFEACTLLLLIGAPLNFAGSLWTQAGHLLMPLVELPTPSMALSLAEFCPRAMTPYAPKVVWVDCQGGELLPHHGENKKTSDY